MFSDCQRFVRLVVLEQSSTLLSGLFCYALESVACYSIRFSHARYPSMGYICLFMPSKDMQQGNRFFWRRFIFHFDFSKVRHHCSEKKDTFLDPHNNKKVEAERHKMFRLKGVPLNTVSGGIRFQQSLEWKQESFAIEGEVGCILCVREFGEKICARCRSREWKMRSPAQKVWKS